MARILYGAPESEREEENTLVARLRDRKRIAYSRNDKTTAYVREKHRVEYVNDFLGFAFELSRCKDLIILPLPRQYDLIMYDTRIYGEDWQPDIRSDHFKQTITPYFEKKEIPIIILADEEIKDKIKHWVLERHFHYIAQPYAVDEVVEKVDSLLLKSRRKKQQ